jgi:hypothetical protein
MSNKIRLTANRRSTRTTLRTVTLPAAVTGTYNFYDTNNNSLASNLTSGSNFSLTSMAIAGVSHRL